MTWRDNLREARFRGVRYFYEESEQSGGRRLVVNEYPRRDDPYVEDMGRKAREWGLTAFVFGMDYMQERDALMQALDQEGAAEWLHPRLGALWVRVDTWSCSESTAEGNHAKFTIRLVEAGKQELPGVSKNTVQRVKNSGSQLTQAVVVTLEEELDVTSGLTLDTAVQTLEQANAALAGVNGLIDAAIAPVSEIAANIDRIGVQAADLLRSPADFVASLADVQFSIYGAYESIREVLNIYDALDTAFEFPSIAPETTATNTAINRNQSILGSAMRSLNTVAAMNAIAGLTRTVEASPSESPFESYSEVVALRDRFLSVLDAVALSAGFDLFDSANALKVEFNEHLNNHGMRLPRVRHVETKEARPLLALAYELTGNAESFDDLRRRNELAQPLYVAQNQTLEYLQ